MRTPFRSQLSGQRIAAAAPASRRSSLTLAARAEVTREFNEGDGKISGGKKKPLYADEAPVSSCQAGFCFKYAARITWCRGDQIGVHTLM